MSKQIVTGLNEGLSNVFFPKKNNLLFSQRRKTKNKVDALKLNYELLYFFIKRKPYKNQMQSNINIEHSPSQQSFFLFIYFTDLTN